MTSNTPKRYRLLKDLPSLKAGAIFDWDDARKVFSCDGKPTLWNYPAYEINKNPDFFQPIPEEPVSEERIEVGGLHRFSGGLSNETGSTFNVYQFTTRKAIFINKLPGLSKVIEDYVNGDWLKEQEKIINEKRNSILEKHFSDTHDSLMEHLNPKPSFQWTDSQIKLATEVLNRLFHAGNWDTYQKRFFEMEMQNLTNLDKQSKSQPTKQEKFVAQYHGRPESDFEKQVKETMEYFGKNILCEECGEIGKHKPTCPQTLREKQSVSILDEAVSLLASYVRMHRMKVPVPYTAMDEQAENIIKAYETNPNQQT